MLYSMLTVSVLSGEATGFGHLQNGEMNWTIGRIISYLTIIAGIMCAFIFLVCIFKMITGDEHDHAVYKKRAIHSIIALIFITGISNVYYFFGHYFGDTEINMGTKRTQQTKPVFSTEETRKGFSNADGSGGGFSGGGGEGGGGGSAGGR